MFFRTQATTLSVVAPGVKISFTPDCFRVTMSSSG
jgi:hypothetical protein